MDRVAGINTGGSERAFDLFMKCRYLDEQHPGHGVVGASGTPISNTMVEMYTMQRFLDPKGLADRGIEHFDAWAATFGEVVDTMEISPGRRVAPAPQPFRQVHQPARAGPDVPGLRRRPDGGDARPAPPRPRRRQAADGRLPDVGGAEGAASGADRALRPPPQREGSIPARTTRWRSPPTAASWRWTAACSSRPEDFPGSKINALVGNVVRIWKKPSRRKAIAARR